jgi:hypothetical protein
MVLYDGSASADRALAEALGLTRPILSDSGGAVFGRADPDGENPDSAFIPEDMTVPALAGIGYPARVEAVRSGASQ